MGSTLNAIMGILIAFEASELWETQDFFFKAANVTFR